MLKLRHYGFHILRYGAYVHECILCISVADGGIAEMLFMLFFAYIAVQRTEHC